MRAKAGNCISLFDGSGKEYQGKIERTSRDRVEVRVLGETCPPGESPLELILVQGIPKAEKMDLIIRGTTELGVSAIWPFFSSRTIPKWRGEILPRRIAHWQKVAMEAARQSGRTKIPEVREPFIFEGMIKEVENLEDGFLKIILWEDEKERGLKEILRENPHPAGVCFFVGPEGGISPDEVSLLKRAGCISIYLGKRILRTETAAISLLSIIQYEWGDLGIK